MEIEIFVHLNKRSSYVELSNVMYKSYLVYGAGINTDTYSIYPVSVETDEQTGWEGDKLASYDFIQKRLSFITGRILTIIDASIPEGKQNKCIKDLIRGEFLSELEQLGALMFDKKKLDKFIEDAEIKGDIETISAKEILGN